MALFRGTSDRSVRSDIINSCRLLRWSSVQSLQHPRDEWKIICRLIRAMMDLRWLPVRERVQFKVALLMHMAHASYITEMMTLISRHSSRCSADSTNYAVPQTREQSWRQSIVRRWTLCVQLIFSVSENDELYIRLSSYILPGPHRCSPDLFRHWTFENWKMSLATIERFFSRAVSVWVHSCLQYWRLV